MSSDRPATVSAAGPGMLTTFTDRAFLDALVAHGPASRAQIARITGLSKPTVSEAAVRLVAAGLVVEAGRQDAEGRGRAGVLYRVSRDHGHAMAVALERGNVAVRTIGLDGARLSEKRIAFGGDLLAALASAREMVAEAAAEIGSPRLAAAVSVAAPVEPVSHRVRALPDAPFAGEVDDLGIALGFLPGEPLIVDNDVNWACAAEGRLPEMEAVADFLYVYLGAGIGAGLYLSGRVHRGRHGTAGEIGFVRTPGGPSVLSQLAAGPLGTRDRRSIDLDAAERLLGFEGRTELLDPLADAIASAVTMADPEMVVLGGPLARIAGVPAALERRIDQGLVLSIRVVTSSISGEGPLEGAASGALELARAAAFG